MPTFEIPDGPTSIEAPRSGNPKTPQPAQASAVYSVTNKSSASASGRLSVKVEGSRKPNGSPSTGIANARSTPARLRR